MQHLSLLRFDPSKFFSSFFCIFYSLFQLPLVCNFSPPMQLLFDTEVGFVHGWVNGTLGLLRVACTFPSRNVSGSISLPYGSASFPASQMPFDRDLCLCDPLALFRKMQFQLPVDFIIVWLSSHASERKCS